MINNDLFYCKNRDTYPPFKDGYYMEEYFLNYYKEIKIITTRKYIPALWTNFQIEGWFGEKKNEMQLELDKWVEDNKSVNGYFTIVQYDDGPKLDLPENTIVYGACSNDEPLPLIYEDKNNTLLNIPKKKFAEKEILCSFVGNITSNDVYPNVRHNMFVTLSNNPNFILINSGGWTPSVNKNNQYLFINTTINSKFALAPRGYGRSSFRFFECFQLGTIPIYLWNDKEWLPFKNKINYDKLCISLHISRINELEKKLLSITEEEYNNMFKYYNEIKHFFELEGMSKEIIELNSASDQVSLVKLSLNDDRKFSLCIPTMDRFDSFLRFNLVNYINNDYIDEIIITDENGNDYDKILERYPNISKIKVYKNPERLGPFLNKLKCCRLAKNEWIALIDSDNYADELYFKTVDEYIKNNNLTKETILAPSFAKPCFNYTTILPNIITKNNINNTNNKGLLGTCMNTGNYVINKFLIDNIDIKDELNNIKLSSACDVIFFNTLLFKQFNIIFHIISNLSYDHVVHDNSIYLLTHKENMDFNTKINNEFFKI